MFATVLAIAIASPGSAVESVSISNFKSGLVCRTPIGGSDTSGWICQPTERVLVTDQGICNYDGENIGCTWVGFEFEYVAGKEGTRLSCVSTSSRPYNSGNPNGILAKDVSSNTYELVLPKKQGRFFNPQYYGIAVQRSKEDDVFQQTTCSAAGKELFSFKYQIHFPVVPKGQETEAN